MIKVFQGQRNKRLWLFINPIINDVPPLVTDLCNQKRERRRMYAFRYGLKGDKL
jgi:hypothetical protein